MNAQGRVKRICAIIGLSYIGLGIEFATSSTLTAWPSSSHWGALLIGSGLASWTTMLRPGHLIVTVAGTLLVVAMALRACVLAVSLAFDPEFTGARADAAWAGMWVAVLVAWLVWVVWSRLVVPTQAWKRT